MKKINKVGELAKYVYDVLESELTETITEVRVSDSIGATAVISVDLKKLLHEVIMLRLAQKGVTGRGDHYHDGLAKDLEDASYQVFRGRLEIRTTRNRETNKRVHEGINEMGCLD